VIPSSSGFLNRDFEIEEQTSQTYRMNFEQLNIRGMVDGLEAMKQAIYKILNTERYQYVIYSWNYGVEFSDLFGEPVSYVLPEIKRRVQEALTYDTRIKSVDNFSFEVERGTVHTTFTAHTIFGEVAIEKAVNF
jgi:phage baseplate assembly protein W